MPLEKAIVSNTIEGVASYIAKNSDNPTSKKIRSYRNVEKKRTVIKRNIKSSVVSRYFVKFLKRLTSDFEISKLAYSIGLDKIYFWIELPEKSSIENEEGISKIIEAYNKSNSIFSIEYIFVFDDMDFDIPHNYSTITF